MAVSHVSGPRLELETPIFRLSLCTRAEPSQRLQAFVAAARAEAELQNLETGAAPATTAAP
jgi:hypothetical protein